MLIGGELNEMVNVLEAGTCIAGITDSAATRTESIAQLPLIDTHVAPIFLFMHSEVFQSSPASRLRQHAGVSSRIFKELSVGFRK